MPPHIPIMPAEVVHFLRPTRGELAVDCTLGGGGHARAILECITPGGRLIGLDVVRRAVEATARALRSEGYDGATFAGHHSSFTTVQDVLARESISGADLMLADLGVSSMQADDAARWFHYKVPGPLDMRLNAETGETAAAFLTRVTEDHLAALLVENADEPHAALIASIITRQPPATTQALERAVRTGLTAAYPALPRPAIKMSVRRTFQAIRIAVNDEFRALDTFLAALPLVLNRGGRVVILTFHSGEDRRVKHAFRDGFRHGVYSDIARSVTRSTMAETRANRRSSSAKLRWAVRT